jgi:hypothetical protein
VCLRFLLANGYIERVRDDLVNDVPMDVYRLTRTGRLFAHAWAESGARQFEFHGADLRPRRAS